MDNGRHQHEEQRSEVGEKAKRPIAEAPRLAPFCAHEAFGDGHAEGKVGHAQRRPVIEYVVLEPPKRPDGSEGAHRRDGAKEREQRRQLPPAPLTRGAEPALR